MFIAYVSRPRLKSLLTILLSFPFLAFMNRVPILDYKEEHGMCVTKDMTNQEKSELVTVGQGRLTLIKPNEFICHLFVLFIAQI